MSTTPATASTDLFPPDNTFRSIDYVAHFFGVSVQTAREWCRDGTLTSAGNLIFRDARGHWWVALKST